MCTFLRLEKCAHFFDRSQKCAIFVSPVAGSASFRRGAPAVTPSSLPPRALQFKGSFAVRRPCRAWRGPHPATPASAGCSRLRRSAPVYARIARRLPVRLAAVFRRLCRFRRFRRGRHPGKLPPRRGRSTTSTMPTKSTTRARKPEGRACAERRNDECRPRRAARRHSQEVRRNTRT